MTDLLWLLVKVGENLGNFILWLFLIAFLFNLSSSINKQDKSLLHISLIMMISYFLSAFLSLETSTYKDYFIFRSNWDPFYYDKYTKPLQSNGVIGTREPKEEKSFFASKTISIPNQIKLETFPEGDIEKSLLGNIKMLKLYGWEDKFQ